MPIYEFACRNCGHHFDHLQKMSDADPTVCPSCHAEQLHRMLSAPAFRLAGTGWYETDFKKPGDHQHNLAGDAGASSATGSTHHHHVEKAAESTAASTAGSGAGEAKASVAASS
ncbi:MAG TPA: zinc ribbon domain-containing protein [Rhodanobacter sp.]|nr:zinc ribbon domain-containing protein [Rhodanobacter sp.]